MKLPPGWSWLQLGDVVEINGQSLPENSDRGMEFFYIDIGSVDNGRVEFPEALIRFDEAPLRARRKFRRGDILMSTVRPTLGGIAYVDFASERFVCSTGFAVLRPKAGTDGRFIFQCLFSPSLRRQYGALTAGSSYPALNATQVAELEILLPEVGEQKKIGAILSTWDRAIDKAQAAVSASIERKQALMHVLLAGRRRYGPFKDKPWRYIGIGSLLEECNRYVEWRDNKAYRFASIRRRSGGLFDRGTFYGREVKTKVLKLLKAGDFVVSKRQVVHGAWGIVTEQFGGFGVSDEYDVLVNRKPDGFDMRFFNYLSQTRRMWHMAYRASNGVHIEKLIFNFREFARERIRIPSSVEEQRKICDLLEACDEEIDLLQKKFHQLKEQKRGLTQRLLTGQIRVNVSRKH